MQTITHPSNPPANAMNFTTQHSDTLEIASWKQSDRPNVQSTNGVFYKVLKFADQYMVIWARVSTSK
jgi:hypothetical protein